MVKRTGIGAVYSAPLKYNHPSNIIHTQFPTMVAKQRLEKLLAIRKEPRKLRGKNPFASSFDMTISLTLSSIAIIDGIQWKKKVLKQASSML